MSEMQTCIFLLENSIAFLVPSPPWTSVHNRSVIDPFPSLSSIHKKRPREGDQHNCTIQRQTKRSWETSFLRSSLLQQRLSTFLPLVQSLNKARMESMVWRRSGGSWNYSVVNFSHQFACRPRVLDNQSTLSFLSSRSILSCEWVRLGTVDWTDRRGRSCSIPTFLSWSVHGRLSHPVTQSRDRLTFQPLYFLLC